MLASLRFDPTGAAPWLLAAIVLVLLALGVKRVVRWIARERSGDPGEEAWDLSEAFPYCTEPPPAPELTLDLRNPIELTLGLLRQLEWSRLQELVLGWYQACGIEAQLASPASAGGVRIFLYRTDSHRPAAYVVCTPAVDASVATRLAHELVASMEADGVGEGVFITAGRIGPAVVGAAGAARVEWIDGARFVEAFGALRVEDRDRILRGVTRGDFTTPTCPRCQAKMVLERRDGKPVWACSQFPRCQQRIPVRAATAVGR